ncbi:hypothetical protein BH10ACT1_BH10ACT1_28580 [soil metagenome]
MVDLARTNSQKGEVQRWPLFFGAALATFSGLALRGFTCDDAAISYRFAQQFAAGHPLGTVTPGDPVVSGFSNPTWTLLLAGLRGLGLPIAGSAKVLGFTFFVLTAVLSTALASRLVERPVLAAIGGLAGASSTVALWSMSGLENGLVTCLLVATVLMSVIEEQRPTSRSHRFGSSLLLALLAVSRPDTFVVLPFAALAKALARSRAGRPWPRAVLDAAALVAIPTATVIGGWAYNWAAFGTPLANPVYAKASRTAGQRIHELLDPTAGPKIATLQFALLLGGAFLLPLVVAAWRRHDGPTTTVALFSAAALVLPLTERDWMVDFRFYATSVPLLLVLAAVGTDEALARSEAAVGQRWRRTVPFVAAALAVWTACNLQATIRTSSNKFEGQVTAEAIRAATLPLADAASRFDLDDPLVMTADAGATTYNLDLRILDLAGLLDPQISHLMEGHLLERWEYAFDERSPDLIRAEDASWSWNTRWHLDRSSLRALGYVPLDGGTNWIKRDLVVRPDPASAGPTRSARQPSAQVEAPEAALAGGDLVVRAWVPVDDRAEQQVKFSLSDSQGRTANLTAQQGAGFSAADTEPGEAVLHVGRLRVPEGTGSLRLTVSVGSPGRWSELAKRSIDRGRPAVLRAVARLEDEGRMSPTDVLRALRHLDQAAPGVRRTDEALERLRSAACASLRLRIRAAARSLDLEELDSMASLIAATRGRADPSSPWRRLGTGLQRQAATTRGEASYRLLAAAAAANPADGSIQRDLLRARLARPPRPSVTP